MAASAALPPLLASAAVPPLAGVLATVLELLVGMGFSHLEAQRMLDRVRAHVGAGATVEEVLLAALRAAPDSGAGAVREAVAAYEQLAA